MHVCMYVLYILYMHIEMTHTHTLSHTHTECQRDLRSFHCPATLEVS